MIDFLYHDTAFVGQIAPLLLRFKQRGDYIWNFRCPFCGDSVKNKTKARGYLFRRGQKLIYKCHNCQISASFSTLLKHLDSAVYNRYLLAKFGNKSQRPEFRNAKITKTIEIAPISLPSFDTIDDRHWVKQYLASRKIPTLQLYRIYFAEKFGSWVREVTTKEQYQNFADEPRIILPIYDIDRKLIGAQGRVLEADSKSQRYITMRFDDAYDLVYGLELCNFSKKIHLVEGPIDSLFLENCIAAMGSDLTAKANWLINNYDVPKENLVLIFDNEKRSKEIQKLVHKAAVNGYNLCIWPDSIKEKDINEAIIAGINVQQIIADNTKNGLEAQLML